MGWGSFSSRFARLSYASGNAFFGEYGNVDYCCRYRLGSPYVAWYLFGPRFKNTVRKKISLFETRLHYEALLIKEKQVELSHR